jgi:hypothetical protein
VFSSISIHRHFTRNPAGPRRCFCNAGGER